MRVVYVGLSDKKSWGNFVTNCRQLTQILDKPGPLPFDAIEREVFGRLGDALLRRSKELPGNYKTDRAQFTVGLFRG